MLFIDNFRNIKKCYILRRKKESSIRQRHVSFRSTGCCSPKTAHDQSQGLESLKSSFSFAKDTGLGLGLGCGLMGSAVPHPFHFQWDLWAPLPSSSSSRVGPTSLHVITTAASLRLCHLLRHHLRLGFLLRSSFKVPLNYSTDSLSFHFPSGKIPSN